MRLGWVTDPHLNFLRAPRRAAFYSTLAARRLDGLLLGGDIGEADSVTGYLRELEALETPVYFVLGNHDFYFGSIRGVRDAVARVAARSRWLHCLSEEGVVHLSSRTALVGHDGWADGRLGDFFGSPVLLNDYYLIEELRSLEPAERYVKLNDLADEAAGFLEQGLRRALIAHENVILLTHVPPYREACWHQGRISDDHWLPHFASRAIGERLTAVMREHPNARLQVLCGHTHSSGTARILDNLVVYTGAAEYGKPALQSAPLDLADLG